MTRIHTISYTKIQNLGPAAGMRQKARFAALCSGLGVAVLGMVVLGGCYERVVKANGIGGSYTQVEPEYRSNSMADRAIDRLTQPAPATGRTERFVDPDSRNPGIR